MEKHNAPKVITFPIEPIRSSIENMVFQLIHWGFQLPRVYESVYSKENALDEERNNIIAVTLLIENGFLGRKYIPLKTLQLITETAKELNITKFPSQGFFRPLDTERDLVKLVADKMLQNCLYLQEKQSHRV